MTIRIARAGVLATVQDLGRAGLQHLGIVPGGAMDPASHRIANALVGNAAEAATIEMAIVGPEIVFERDALVALHGARFPARIDGGDMPLSRPVLVRAGTRLQMGRASLGCYGYLAVAGGIDVPKILHSRCTYLPAAFGGWQGKPLAAGATLPLAEDVESLSQGRFARLEASRTSVEIGPKARSVRWFVPSYTLTEVETPIIRAVEGLHAELFADASRAAFYGETWRVAPDSNRIGLRLVGPTLALVTPTEIVSQATCLGTVQVPAGGQPIALMADHQTTGGYPKIAEVIAADVASLSQLPPGGSVRFKAVSLDDADAAREAFGARIQSVLQRLNWEFGNEDD